MCLLNYLKAYLKAPFAKETLNDYLWEIFKELKMGNSNEKGLDQATLQCDEVLKQLMGMQARRF